MPGTTVQDVLGALDRITGGRMVTSLADLLGQDNPFVVTKSSGIPGKDCLEIPGLICGRPQQAVRRLAVVMTLTETALELAGATQTDLLIAHHPVADAASSGGVPLRTYAGLYGVAVIEAHEAFHGRHPGIPLLHGIRPRRTEVAYGGLPGNVMVVGEALPGIRTAGDMLRRVTELTDLAIDDALLETERRLRDCPDVQEASSATRPQMLHGGADRPVRHVLHIFPHTGFTPVHLAQALAEHPEIDTLLLSISRVPAQHPLVAMARQRGLTVIAGNTHALEIWENGLPLAHALRSLLPAVEVLLFRERISAVPLQAAGSATMHAYAREMAENHLLAETEQAGGKGGDADSPMPSETIG